MSGATDNTSGPSNNFVLICGRGRLKRLERMVYTIKSEYVQISLQENVAMQSIKRVAVAFMSRSNKRANPRYTFNRLRRSQSPPPPSVASFCACNIVREIWIVYRNVVPLFFVPSKQCVCTYTFNEFCTFLFIPVKRRHT